MKTVKPHYLQEGAYKVNLEVNKIKEEFQNPNREYALQYKRFLELNNRKEKTIARRLEELRHVLKLLPKDAKKATKDDIEKVVMALNKAKRQDSQGRQTNQDLASITKGKLKLVLKTFYKWLYQSDTYPDIVRWIKVEDDSRHKLPDEMLTEEDVKKLIGVCKNQRDKTIIALFWDTGMRLGEMLSLKMKDIQLSEGTSYAMVSGKTGDRRVPLVFSVPYLANHINNLRTNAKADDPLFTIMDHNTVTNRPIDYPNIRKLLTDLKKRAGLEKRLHPHLFRHSRATYYANMLTEQQAKAFFGWSGSSNMVARYTHLSGRDIDNAILKANGLVNEKGEQIQPKPSIKRCLKCQEVNEITAKHCSRCGTPLDIVQVMQAENMDSVRQELNYLKAGLDLLMSRLDKDSQVKIDKIVP